MFRTAIGTTRKISQHQFQILAIAVPFKSNMSSLSQRPSLDRKSQNPPSHQNQEGTVSMGDYYIDPAERAIIEAISLSSFGTLDSTQPSQKTGVNTNDVLSDFDSKSVSEDEFDFTEDDDAILKALELHLKEESSNDVLKAAGSKSTSSKEQSQNNESSISESDSKMSGSVLENRVTEASKPMQTQRNDFFTIPIDLEDLENTVKQEVSSQKSLKRAQSSPVKSTTPQKVNRQTEASEKYDVDHPSNPYPAPYSPSLGKFRLQAPQVIQQTRHLSNSSTTKATYPTIQLSTQVPQADEVNRSQNDTARKIVRAMLLTSEQEYILQQAVSGTSLFYTGSAGTGKSILLKSIIKSLRRKYRPGNVAVTASTGLAACNIGGITLHSFSGVGLGAEPVDKLLKKVRTNKKALERWINTKVLIIDEISMVDGEFLNKLNEIAKKIRRNDRPFGGIQLIVCGDFYQLPPVVKSDPNRDKNLPPKEPFFSFECEAWLENIQLTLVLREVFRQKGDQTFINMLNEMRTGLVSDQTSYEFSKLRRPVVCPTGLSPSELFATRNEVERSNNERLSKLEGASQKYEAVDGGTLPNPQRQVLCNNFLAPMHLFLKIGAQVMCIKNFDDTLVNGSMGKVVDFMYKDTYMKAREREQIEAEKTPDVSVDASIETNVTKHGIDHPDIPVNPDYIFSDLELLSGKDPVSDAKAINRRRKKQLGTDLDNGLNKRMYPVVKFTSSDGSSRTVLFEPEQWTIEDDKDQSVLASRTQFPLILAWALSIHKSQGQTLQHVMVDLRNIFEKGQAYVALSRATNREGLQVLNFSKDKVSSHRKVIDFYKTLLSANEHGIKHNFRPGQQHLPFQTANSQE